MMLGCVSNNLKQGNLNAENSTAENIHQFNKVFLPLKD